MGIQSFTPSGGGGTPGFDYVASIFMQTFARSWAQGGAAGYYMMSSANESTGYVYFIGAQTTAGPLGKTLLVNHSFTSIEVVANKNELVSLYKGAAKTTTDIANPGSRYVDWLYNAKYTSFIYKSGTTNTSSPWMLPGSAMPLVDIALIAGGGGSRAHSGGAGGGGLVYLTYFPVTSSGLTWTVGAAGTVNGGYGGNTTLGSITAVGGAPGPDTPGNGIAGGNASGAATHGSQGSRSGASSTQGQPSVTSPTVGAGYGHGSGNMGNSSQHIGTGGGGAGGPSNSGGQTPGGPGFLLPIDFQYYSAGGGGANHDNKIDGVSGQGAGNWGQGANSLHGGGTNGIQGGIVLRYYT